MEWRKIQLNNHQLNEIKDAEQDIKNSQLLKRLQAIKLKDKQWKHKDIAEFLCVRLETISVWIKTFSEKGVEGLLEWHYKGKPSQLTEKHKSQLKKRHKEKPFDTAKEAKDYIEKEFGKIFHLHWVQKLLKKNFDCHTKKQP